MAKQNNFYTTKILMYTGSQWLIGSSYYALLFSAFNLLGGVLYPGQWEQRFECMIRIIVGFTLILLVVYGIYFHKVANQEGGWEGHEDVDADAIVKPLGHGAGGRQDI